MPGGAVSARWSVGKALLEPTEDAVGDLEVPGPGAERQILLEAAVVVRPARRHQAEALGQLGQLGSPGGRRAAVVGLNKC